METISNTFFMIYCNCLLQWHKLNFLLLVSFPVFNVEMLMNLHVLASRNLKLAGDFLSHCRGPIFGLFPTQNIIFSFPN